MNLHIILANIFKQLGFSERTVTHQLLLSLPIVPKKDYERVDSLEQVLGDMKRSHYELAHPGGQGLRGDHWYGGCSNTHRFEIHRVAKNQFVTRCIQISDDF